MLEVLRQLQELSPEALHEKCSKVNSRRALADWQMAACLLACELTGLHRRHDCSSVVQYAVRFLNMDPQKSSELLRAATFLEHLPHISEAFRIGRIGWGKVRELKSVVTPETEEEWLAYALAHSVGELQRAVAMNSTEARRRAQAATLASAKAPGGDDLFSVPVVANPGPHSPRVAGEGAPVEASGAAAPHVAREPEVPASATRKGGVAHPPDMTQAPGVTEPVGGAPAGAATLAPTEVSPPTDTPSAAEALLTAKPRESQPVAPVQREAAGFPLPPSQPQLVRVTLLFTPEEFVAFDEGVKHARKLLQQKRARREAAVAEMARRSLAVAPTRTRARHTVVVHVNAETGGAWFETERGTLPVSADELAEALTTGTVTYANGPDSLESDSLPEIRTRPETLSRGKGKRPPIPVHILRQLYARAGGCCEVPGCTNRQNLHVHHRKAWSRGGTHELECLELRCSACHGLTHEDDFRDDPEWSRARARKRSANRKRRAPAG